MKDSGPKGTLTMSAANNIADRLFQQSMSPFDWPRVRISNKAELHLQLKELDDDGVEWRYLAYSEEDKGALESSSQAGSCCNPAHLKAIRHNLTIANKACQLEIDAEYSPIEDVLMATLEELSRLQRHPELFLSKDIQEEFWQSIACHQSLNYIRQRQEARDHAHRTLQATKVEFDEETRAPGRDMQRKPWEQFFHNRGPGTAADLSMFPEDGSAQIIPMAAARILMANLDEHKAIVLDIEAQREELNPHAPFSGNSIRSTGLRHSPDGHIRSHRAFTDLLKPTIAGPINMVRSGEDMNSLETLNLDFAALNRRRPPLRPRMWNCVDVVLQDRPNYDGVDSQQRDEKMEEMMSMFT